MKVRSLNINSPLKIQEEIKITKLLSEGYTIMKIKYHSIWKVILIKDKEVDLQINHLQLLQDNIAKWSDTTFGNGNRGLGMCEHLSKEVKELKEAIKVYDSGINLFGKEELEKEVADCFILLLDIARTYDMSVGDIFYATTNKLITNLSRKWGSTNPDGSVEHIKD